MPEYRRGDSDGFIPSNVKWMLTVFNRAGFPAVAFLIVSYICFVTIKDHTRVIVELKEAIVSMKDGQEKNTEAIERMTSAINEIRRAK